MAALKKWKNCRRLKTGLQTVTRVLFRLNSLRPKGILGGGGFVGGSGSDGDGLEKREVVLWGMAGKTAGEQWELFKLGEKGGSGSDGDGLEKREVVLWGMEGKTAGEQWELFKLGEK
nr:hypothetical protein [Tanacetum cinerariifolium]